MSKKFAVGGVILLAVSVICGAAYAWQGSTVMPDGTLREPFGLIPLAWLSGLAGGALLLVGRLWK